MVLVLAEHRVFGDGDAAGQHNLGCKVSHNFGKTFRNCSSPYSVGSDVIDLESWLGHHAVPPVGGPGGAGLWDPSPVLDTTTGDIFVHYEYSIPPNTPAVSPARDNALHPWTTSNHVIRSTDRGTATADSSVGQRLTQTAFARRRTDLVNARKHHQFIEHRLVSSRVLGLCRNSTLWWAACSLRLPSRVKP